MAAAFGFNATASVLLAPVRHACLSGLRAIAALKYFNAASVSTAVAALVFAPTLFFRIPLSIAWVALSATFAAIQGVYVAYQLAAIALSLTAMAFLLGGRQALAVAARIAGGRGDGRLTAMERASTWAEYASLAAAGDGGAWADDDGDLPATLLRRAIDDLSAARAAARSGGGSGALTFALASLTKRNHLGIEDAEWYPVGTNGTKRLIDAYVGGA